MMQHKYSTKSILRDGEQISIRAISEDDKELLLAGFHRLSRQSVKYRFLGLKNELTHDELIYFTEIDHEKHVALVATSYRENVEHIVGVGRFIETDENNVARSAEIGLAVIDEYQNKGIGSHLFLQLKNIAIQKGIRRLEAYVLSDNCRMCDIFRHHGSNYTCTREDDVFRVVCTIQQ